MRAPSIPASEKYRLVMDCRQSGLSDHQWCTMNGIKPGTFYNWIKRLRQKGVTDIAPPAGRNTYEPTPKQEVERLICRVIQNR
jgi:transposase-like protein